MAGKIDFRELDEFYVNMEITRREYGNFLSSFLFEMANRVINDTKLNTPVDTGALRASWGITTKNTMPREVMLYSGRKGRYIPKILYDRIGDVVKEGFGKSMSIMLNNPQEYATQIEYGFMLPNGEWYQGRYMLTKALAKNEIERKSLYEVKFLDFKRRMGL